LIGYVYFEAGDVLLLYFWGQVRCLFTHVDEVGGRRCIYTDYGLMRSTVEVWHGDKG
jgi:hypothetical protein